MTTNLAIATPLSASSSGAAERHPRVRPELVEVTATRAQRRARPRIVSGVIAIGALGLLLLAQLGISMVLSKGAYQLDALQSQQTELSRTQQQLDEHLGVLRSPQNLATNAQALGMIANSTPVYLDPKTGAVYGTPTPAAAGAKAGDGPNQVPNALLDGTGVVTRQGDTAASAEQPAAAPTPAQRPETSSKTTTSTSTSTAATGRTTTGTDAGKHGAASASDSGSSSSSVSSDADQLQAPITR